MLIALSFDVSMSLIMGPLKKFIKEPANSDQTFPCRFTTMSSSDIRKLTSMVSIAGILLPSRSV